MYTYTIEPATEVATFLLTATIIISGQGPAEHEGEGA